MRSGSLRLRLYKIGQDEMRLVIELPQKLLQLLLLLCQLARRHRLILSFLIYLLLHPLDKDASQSPLLDRCPRELIIGLDGRQHDAGL